MEGSWSCLQILPAVRVHFHVQGVKSHSLRVYVFWQVHDQIEEKVISHRRRPPHRVTVTPVVSNAPAWQGRVLLDDRLLIQRQSATALVE